MGKYLPIGTICNLKETNKKVMIIGYYSVSFDGNIKINDYIGCVYPEGLLKFGQILSFNHGDIENIIFKGYLSSDYDKFNSMLNGISGNEPTKTNNNESNKTLASNRLYSKIEFDENGVVVVAEPLKQNTTEAEKRDSKEKYEFDENGTVISVSGSSNVENPFHKEFDRKESNKEVNYKDIIRDKNLNVEPKLMKTLNRIEFDENGVVISEGNYNDTKTKGGYTFDENGIIISENIKKKSNKGTYKFDEDGVIIEDSVKSVKKYRFDENGVVVEEK